MPNFFKRGTVDLDAVGGGAKNSAKLTHSVAQAFPQYSTALQVAALDTVVFNNGLTVTNNRITFPTAGVYVAGASVVLDTVWTWEMWLRMNGAGNPVSQQAYSTHAKAKTETIINVAANDFVELIVYHNSATTPAPNIHAGVYNLQLWAAQIA